MASISRKPSTPAPPGLGPRLPKFPAEGFHPWLWTWWGRWGADLLQWPEALGLHLASRLSEFCCMSWRPGSRTEPVQCVTSQEHGGNTEGSSSDRTSSPGLQPGSAFWPVAPQFPLSPPGTRHAQGLVVAGVTSPLLLTRRTAFRVLLEGCW